MFAQGNAQQILSDLSNYKSSTLSNGITIITVHTSTDSLINYRFIIDFDPKIQSTYPGVVQIITRYYDFYLNGETQLFQNMVSDTNSIDTTFDFINKKISNLILDNQKIQKAIQLETKKHNMLAGSLYEHKQISKRFCLGKNSPFSIYPDNDDFSMINNQTIILAMKEILQPSNFYIVTVGNIEHDTAVKYANKNFSFWTNNSQIPPSNYNFNKAQSSKINFKNSTSTRYISASYPLKYFYTDDNFFSKQILLNIFNDKIKTDLNTNTNNVTFDILPNPTVSKFCILAEMKPGEVYNTTMQISNSLKDMLIYTPTTTQLNNAKSKIGKIFSASIKNPFTIANYAYTIYKYNLPKNYFSNYIHNISNISISGIKNTAKELFFADNVTFVIQDNYTKSICDLYALAQFYKIEFYDKNFNKYKIIPQGFDASFVINDYLDACNADNIVKNLTIKFHTDYQADTIYTVKGIIYKKAPNLFFYKTMLYIDDDSLLQQLQIANNKTWLDSCALGTKYYTNSDEFWAKIYQAYIFPELYYDRLNYSTNILCDTVLQKQNIFKVKVTTPYNVYFYDYYNLNTKEKIKTETIIKKGIKEDTLLVVNYSNYKKISKTSDIKMPFTITEKIKDYEFTMQIDTINTKARLSKKLFMLPNQ